ncbi:LPS biosynthesis protein [Alphaproteobacteria bacterium]|nr:LPS biosynthesis protein [Alphaproteobacteria bacterium]
MIPCSVYMVAKNSAECLPRALASVRDFAQIVIVVDAASTDRTEAVARATPNAIVQVRPWEGYVGSKTYALSLCTQEWALNLDADEEVTPELAAEISRIIEAGQADAINVTFTEYFLGKPNHPWIHTHDKVRAFRRGKGEYEAGALVHEGIVVAGKTVDAKGRILHYGNNRLSDLLAKDAVYSTLKARERYARGQRPRATKLLFTFAFTFLVQYFLRRNFLNGWRGFIQCKAWAMYSFSKEAKLYSMWKTGGDI